MYLIYFVNSVHFLLMQSFGFSIYCLVFGSGWLLWWASEYLIHRFVGHGQWIRLPFALHHRKHHALGNYFAPLIDKVKISVIVGASIFLLVALLCPWKIAAVFTSGFILSYLGYEWLHRRAHTHPPRSWYGRWARRHHFHHHFMDPSSNHGVTTSWGDLLFATKRVPAKIRVPEKLKMPWLTDPKTGEVWSEFSDDYEIIALKKRVDRRVKNTPSPAKTNQEISVPCV